MTKYNKHPKTKIDVLRGAIAASGTIAVAAIGVHAQPAKAQSGGVEAPPAVTTTVVPTQSGGAEAPTAVTLPAPTQSGGVEAPATTLTEADQALNLQAQKAASTLARRIAKLSTANNTVVSYMHDAQGNKLATTTVAIPAKTPSGGNTGEYDFSIVSAAMPDGKRQFNDIYSVSASEGVRAHEGSDLKSYGIVGLNKNPATQTWEVSGVYNAPASDIEAGIQSVSPTASSLTTSELGAVVYQIGEIANSVKLPVNELEPAFNDQGSTVDSPEN